MNRRRPSHLGLIDSARILGPPRLGIPGSPPTQGFERRSWRLRRDPRRTPTFEEPTVPPPIGDRGDEPILVQVIIDESPSEALVDPNGYRHIAARRIMELLRTTLKNRDDR